MSKTFKILVMCLWGIPFAGIGIVFIVAGKNYSALRVGGS